MLFSSYDGLRTFDVVARHLSFTNAAMELNLTKGAVGYQIKQLEEDLGFQLFVRHHRRIELTEKGRRLWHAAHVALRDLDREIAVLRETGAEQITIGMTTYFTSRWLSPRLMTFIASHPEVSLRLQPSVDLDNFPSEGIDMAIRWGDGNWQGMEIERLISCPAFATVGTVIADRIAEEGMEAVLSSVPLLHDRDGSVAWRDWHEAAGIPYRPQHDGLVIPDPNVRVQAVIDGQGAALNDAFVGDELASGKLVRISNVQLDAYGYFLVYPRQALEQTALSAFHDWIIAESEF